MTAPTVDLRAAWLAHKASHPHAHSRDFAQAIGVSECAVIASFAGTTRLRPEWQNIIRALAGMGRVKTMTRNEDAVIEQHGAYENVEFFGSRLGQTVGTAIDLRIFLASWTYGYAVTEDGAHGIRRSFQFFDRSGVSIHKMYEEPDSAIGVYDTIVDQFRADDQSMPEIEPAAAQRPEQDDNEIDVVGFRSAWDNLRDTHDFHAILKEFGVSRLQALRLAGAERARSMVLSVAEQILTDAATTQRKIMIFVGNAGLIQIFIGTINNVVRARGWLNVLDPDFNLHLRDQNIATAWWVRKPTADGFVNSIELFAADGTTIALFFSKREPGQPESPEWSEFLSTLPSLDA